MSRTGTSPARQSWIRVALTAPVMGGALFCAAGRVDWVAAWAYIALVALMQVAVILTVQRTSPDLLAERDRMRAGTKPWDKVIAPLIALGLPACMWVAAGLDLRHGWSAPLDAFTQYAGFAVAAVSGALTTWAMAANRFFASTVRLQADRGQHVVSSGPYAHVRHPGCVGMIGFTLATPAVLGSRLAFVPAVVCFLLLIVRTALEDSTLRAELEGYGEYARRVRWRLLPGLW
jgi:protein-S-isoprenylcysteine O-methyltransferase Ste14